MSFKKNLKKAFSTLQLSRTFKMINHVTVFEKRYHIYSCVTGWKCQAFTMQLSQISLTFAMHFACKRLDKQHSKSHQQQFIKENKRPYHAIYESSFLYSFPFSSSKNINWQIFKFHNCYYFVLVFILFLLISNI